MICISNLHHHFLGRSVTTIGLSIYHQYLSLLTFIFSLLPPEGHTGISYLHFSLFREFTLVYLISRDSQILRDFQRDSQLSCSRLITRATFSSRDSALATLSSRDSPLARLPAASMCVADPLAIYVTVSPSPLMFSSITQQWLQSRSISEPLHMAYYIVIHLFVLNMRYLHSTWCPESSPQ